MDSPDNLDEIIAALTDRRRRYALYHLREEEILELEALARRVAAWEADSPPDEVSDDEVERLRVEFHHEHVGVFRQAACIEYDDRSGVIRYRDPPEPLPDLLDAVSAVEHPERE